MWRVGFWVVLTVGFLSVLSALFFGFLLFFWTSCELCVRISQGCSFLGQEVPMNQETGVCKRVNRVILPLAISKGMYRNGTVSM